jgi:hypothetical protein
VLRRAACAALALAHGALVPACGARACSDREERTVQAEVEVLTAEAGGMADTAERRLLARGAEAIPYLEIGLYREDPLARRRIVRTLVRLGDARARPILAHLARRDPDGDVRAAAAAGLERLPLAH